MLWVSNRDVSKQKLSDDQADSQTENINLAEKYIYIVPKIKISNFEQRNT